jgi:hypothetical protein
MGVYMKSEEKKKKAGKKSDESEYWNRRKLCIDGNCIGVVGDDGRCKECGKPYSDVSPEPDEDVAPVVEVEPENEPEKVEITVAESLDSGDYWKNRRLCPDGNCIGVIGSDGRCKECGESETG